MPAMGLERRGLVPALGLGAAVVVALVVWLGGHDTPYDRIERIAGQAGISHADVLRSVASACRPEIDSYVWDDIQRNPMVVPLIADGHANGADCLRMALASLKFTP